MFESLYDHRRKLVLRYYKPDAEEKIYRKDIASVINMKSEIKEPMLINGSEQEWK